ncbi:MAG: DUF1015 domain-containing protein [Sandaracinaceae bacterium]|nr:DUF1015 domain-containing protein [Sandaracinaceae bacterium]
MATTGLVGLRPDPDAVLRVTAPPYDVIKEGSALEARLRAQADSIYHVTLGPEPRAALDRMVASGALVRDDEPAYYVYEQRWGDEVRTGVFVAAAVTDYAERQVIRHEKTFDDKVKGRVALANATEHTIGPVFLLTKGALGEVLERAKAGAPLYAFESDFGSGSDLTGIASRVWRVLEASEVGAAIQAVLGGGPLYIADGHHRYHAALKNGLTHLLAYVTEGARILAYDRVVNGVVPFEQIRERLDLTPADAFTTPDKHAFCLYTKQGTWTLPAGKVPDDVVGRLDCSILERELYPHLGLKHEHIVDPKHFDYYPESALDEMQAAVDAGAYELAIALHPVSIEELMAVADAGLEDSEVVMPEKSTFFSPKILTGIFLYRHHR